MTDSNLTDNRLEQLRAWGLTRTLLRMSDGELPHPAFNTLCEPLRIVERRQSTGLNLDRVEARTETGGHLSAALWEHDVGDGHAFDVVYRGKEPGGIEFWHVMYANDTDGPSPERIARSEQGLFYWMFFSLIGSEFFRHGQRAYSTLADAAESVRFEHLIEALRLEEEIGSDYDRRGEPVHSPLNEHGRRLDRSRYVVTVTPTCRTLHGASRDPPRSITGYPAYAALGPRRLAD